MPVPSHAMLFDIEHYAIHDGPGIRTTIFFKGCPLRCQWCANPESQQMTAELFYTEDLCLHCGECTRVCPNAAIQFESGERRHDRRQCNGCGSCAQTCTTGALEKCGFALDMHTLWKQVKDDRAFWDRSGGGITLSGGEPLLQYQCAAHFLSVCKRNYVHTAVETCGHVPMSHIEAVFPHVDLFIFDFKTAVEATHERLTGFANQQIKKNLSTVLRSGVDVLVRMPLVPGLNDAPEELAALGCFLETQRPGVCFEILGYHRLGIGKYERLCRPYALDAIEVPSAERIQAAKAIFRKFRLTVI
jgi:pyruvate formate lyase activating enzyme